MLCYHSIGRTWSNFFPPLSLCSLSLPVRFLGSIIRCMRRLEELLRQMCQAAKAIGNTELENKFALGIYSFPLITNALNQKLAFITYSCSYRKRFARYAPWAYLVIHKPAWWNELQPFSWNFTALTCCLLFFFFSSPPKPGITKIKRDIVFAASLYLWRMKLLLRNSFPLSSRQQHDGGDRTCLLTFSFMTPMTSFFCLQTAQCVFVFLFFFVHSVLT